MPFGITFRTTNLAKWGAGKGTPLTSEEVDESLWGLAQAIGALQANPAQPKQITSVDYNNFQLIFSLDDGTDFRVGIPVLRWRWRTEGWVPSSQYRALDVFKVPGVGLVLATMTHVSGTDFDLDALDASTGARLYELVYGVIEQPTVGTDSISMFFRSVIPGDSRVLTAYVATQTFRLPVNMAGSAGYLDTAPAGSMVLPVMKNDTLIGQVTFAAGSRTPTFSLSAVTQFEYGDRLKILEPAAPDGAAAGLMVSLAVLMGAG